MSAVWLILLGYAGYAGLLFVTQRSVVFPGTRLARPAVTSPPAGVEQLWLPFSEGRAEAWLVPAATAPPWPVLVFAHGNAELIGDWIGVARALAAEGVAVLLVEYPGYGRSDGRPTRGTIREVYRAAYDGVVEHEYVDSERVVGWGRSLGGGAITDLARERPLRALVLESTFTSAAAMARRMLVPGFLVRDRFDNAGALGRFDGPALIFHGRRDDVVPYAHGVRLAGLGASFELVSWDCAHNDCPPDLRAYVGDIADFFARHGLLRPGTPDESATP